MYNRTRRFSEDDEDLSINSEVIWAFNDVEKDLLKTFANGKCLSEQIISIGGLYTWRVDFYPNGRDHRTYGNVVVVITLQNMKGYDKTPVEAECNFTLLNKMKRQNYVGKIERRKYELNQAHDDSSFENSILKECYPFYPLQITISINQFPFGSSVNNSLRYATQLNKSMINLSHMTSAIPRYTGRLEKNGDSNQNSAYTSSSAYNFEEEDFKRENAQYMYNKYRNQ